MQEAVKKKPHKSFKKQVKTECHVVARLLKSNNYMAFLFMIRDDFDLILGKVCGMTELSVEKVCKSHQEECVDARHLVIAVLSERYSDRQIAEVSGWSIQLINKARNSFHNRCKFRWGLKELYKNLQK